MTNDQVTLDFKRKIQNGEIFQMYFSMKDPEKTGEVTV